MDHWAPTTRGAPGGTGTTQMTNDINSISAALGPFTVGTAPGADNAAHATPGDLRLNAYGELAFNALGIFSGTTSRAGFLFRFVDASNYYAAYLTLTGAAVDSVVAGAATSLMTTSFTLGTVPAVFRAEINDDAISVFWRGAHAGSVRDSSLVAPGHTCLYLRTDGGSTQVQVNRFEVGPLTASYSADMGGLTQQAGPTLRHARLR